MRAFVTFILLLVWLVASPLAQAVACVMQQPVAAAVETYHCPMMAELAAKALPKMSVAECLELKGVTADVVVACPIHNPSSSVVMPTAMVRTPAPWVLVQRVHAPPDIGNISYDRKVLALQRRVRI